jgi:hypothetical protein
LVDNQANFVKTEGIACYLISSKILKKSTVAEFGGTAGQAQEFDQIAANNHV